MAALRLAVITDSHLCSPGTPYGRWHDRLLLPESWTLWDQAVNAVATSDADAVVLLGDVTNFAEPDMLARALRELARAGKPIVAVAGNHDVGPSGDALAQVVAGSPERVATVPGLTPCEIPGLPGFRFAGIPIGRTPEGGYAVAGPGVGEAAPDRPLIVLTHYPLIDIKADFISQNLKYPDLLAGAPAVAHDLQRRDRPVIVLHGHVHRQHATHRAKLLHLGMAPLIERPHAVTFLTLRDGPAGPSAHRETTPLRAAPDPADAREHWLLQDGRWVLSPTPPAQRVRP
ncbi:3',5'-cyclic AMP phosphodiesterase CpdA [Thermocatellispora tengchongensis]|uniref:3',5'-cyclic AMP phosphodiesterase CpdA n=1 Tax=Thermocatellispora tengchongensis TaxID=1073253 RepID=A0A840PHJ5_9ACTN|nr:metallophosphoesterase [Thermocatellispora tengchongensis]MBB5139028.1 3',5'-cyclic AMP phosphodiesterase CpdA [Thermocatellispora tengchongensis]